MIYFSENERRYSTQWGRPLLNRLIQLRSTIWSTCCMCPICGSDMWCTRPDSVAYPYYVFLRCENMFDGLYTDWILQNNSTSPNLRASQSPLRRIRMILDRIQIRKWIGEKARINVQYITSCRPWNTWFLDLNVNCCNLKTMCKHHDQQYCPAPNLFFLPCLRPFIARPGCSRSSQSPSKAEWSGTQMGTMPLSSWEEQACYCN